MPLDVQKRQNLQLRRAASLVSPHKASSIWNVRIETPCTRLLLPQMRHVASWGHQKPRD